MTAAVGARPGDSGAVTKRGRSWFNGVIAGLLVIDALVTLVLEVLFLPIYAGQANVPQSDPLMAEASALAANLTAGAIPLPLTALAAAVVNVLLVAGMATVTDNLGLIVAPLTVWTLGYLYLALFAGPGNDVVLIQDWPSMLLLLCGLFPAGLYLYWRVNANLRPATR
ncbi:hypothetical protein [Nocardia crassostreae]|uniref:hypothetical protein n=1 Tax=Nocardia crassostreae TaxID=53428 RepID=UPI00082A27E7|nr:hypothetical protein [Nocardia crassostreae]